MSLHAELTPNRMHHLETYLRRLKYDAFIHSPLLVVRHLLLYIIFYIFCFSWKAHNSAPSLLFTWRTTALWILRLVEGFRCCRNLLLLLELKANHFGGVLKLLKLLKTLETYLEPNCCWRGYYIILCQVKSLLKVWGYYFLIYVL